MVNISDSNYKNKTSHIRIPTYLFCYIILTIINAVVYLLLPERIAAITATIFCILFLLIDLENGVYFWIASNYYIYILDTVSFAIASGALLLILFLRLVVTRKKCSIKSIISLAVALIIIVLSYRFGHDSQILSAALTLSNIIIYALLTAQFCESKYIARMEESFWVMAILFSGITLISFFQNGFTSVGRLSFGDNVRDMANSVVVAVFLWICSKISRTASIGFSESFQNLIGIVSASLLLLTLAKGPIFSLVAGVCVYGVMEKKIGKVWQFVIIALLIIAMLQVFEFIDFSRFGQRNYDLNGRTNIWGFYLSKTISRGWRGYLLGLGPGNVKRIAPFEYYGRYYAHSTILDFFFSYGLLGFGGLCIFLIKLATEAIRIRNSIGLSLLVMTTLSYLVSGSSTNTQLFILLFFVKLTNVCLRRDYYEEK